MGLNGKKTLIGIIGLAVFGGFAKAFPDQAWLTYLAQSFGGLAAVGAAHKVKKWKDGKAVFGLLAALSLGMSGCATVKASTAKLGEGLKETGAAIVEDVDWRVHLDNLIDYMFGEEELPDEPEPDSL